MVWGHGRETTDVCDTWCDAMEGKLHIYVIHGVRPWKGNYRSMWGRLAGLGMVRSGESVVCLSGLVYLTSSD